MFINPSKSAKENLLALIKKSKNIDILPSEVDITNLTVVSDPSSFNRSTPNAGFNPNTQVTITAKSDSVNFVGSTIVKYRRIILEEAWLQLHDTTNIKYTKANLPAVNEDNVKALIKSLFKFIEADITTSVNIDNKNATITLSSKSESLVYTGNLTLSITPAESRRDLSEIITTDALSGFDYETKLAIESLSIPSFIYG